jgi:hypothetical protein
MISKQEEAVLIALAELMKDIFVQRQLQSARRVDQLVDQPLTTKVQ